MDSETLGLVFLCKKIIEEHGVHAKIRIPKRSDIVPSISTINRPELEVAEGFAAFILCDLIEPIIEYEKSVELKLKEAETKNIIWERLARDNCFHGSFP